MDEKLTAEELEVLETLGKAAGMFFKLKSIHQADHKDFEYAIHLAQNLVLARPGMRQYQRDNGFSYNLKVNA
jgi:hypothetical protein